MSFYRWAMRNGAGILFIAALLIFVVSFASRFFLYGPEFQSALNEQGMTKPKVTIFTNFWGAIGQAASNSAWPFFGACFLNRFDKYWGSKKEPPQ
jgi:hypothetical protein